MDARKIDADVFFPPSPSQKEDRAGERKPMTSNLKPLAPTLSPLGRGEGAKVAPFDLIFSNAALHWVDDHEAILRGDGVRAQAGGRLVISCGGKGNAHDVFVALRPEIRMKRWRQFFRRMPKPYFFYSPADYEKWLPRSGFKTLNVRLMPKDATYGGRDRFHRVVAHDLAALCPARAGTFARGIHRRRCESLCHQASAGRGRQIHVRMVRLEIDAVKI